MVTSDKTVIITGGGKGIGADISSVFYENGYNVIIGAREDNGYAAKLGDRCHFFQTDVKISENLQALVAFAQDKTGRLDVMVNNAGFSEWRPINRIDETFWYHMIDTNLKGPLFGCQAAAARMNSGGCIINISSLAGKRGSFNNSVYCASKFGVNGITQALAKELGPRGIRVNALCPVLVKTEGLVSALDHPDSPCQGKNVQDFLDDFTRSQSALERLPSGTEVGEACVFLASESSSAITGQCINVDCGVLPQ